MTHRTLARALLLLSLVAGAAEAQRGRRGHGPATPPPAVRPGPVQRAPALDANGLPTFADAPAPLAPATRLPSPAVVEAQVQAMLAERCPAAPVDTAGQARLVAFDRAFAGDLGGAAGAVAQQVALEAYRRCLDRAIAAVQASPNYVVRNPEEASCLDCPVLLSDLAVQVPRLRMLKGLTYLAPSHMADQRPRQALELLRQSVADFGTVQAAFQQQAHAAFEEKRRLVQERRREGERDAARRGRTTALNALLGAGRAILGGQGAGEALESAGSAAGRDLPRIVGDLAKREASVAVQQSAVNANKRNAFAAPTIGNWSDDGIRVTLPRVVAPLAAGDGAVTGAPFGGLAASFHADRIVRILFKEGDGSLNACTGSIVGPRLILTNRHCVTTEGGEGAVLTPNAFTIEWRYATGDDSGLRTAVTTSRVQRVVTTDLGQRLSRVSLNDWAFLITREKVGRDGMLRLADPARVAAAGEFRIALAGYSADLNEGSEITMDWGCRARWIAGSLFHRCHMWSGASGSPIVAVDGGFARDEIVALNAADYGDLQSGSQEGLRVGPASAEMYQTWVRLRNEQRGDE